MVFNISNFALNFLYPQFQVRLLCSQSKSILTTRDFLHFFSKTGQRNNIDNTGGIANIFYYTQTPTSLI